MSPKLNSGNDQKHLSGSIATDITFLTCSAQAFPVPVSRWVFYSVANSSSFDAFESRLSQKVSFSFLKTIFRFLVFSCRTNRFCVTKDQHRWSFVSSCRRNRLNFKLDLPSSKLSLPFVPVRMKKSSFLASFSVLIESCGDFKFQT